MKKQTVVVSSVLIQLVCGAALAGQSEIPAEDGFPKFASTQVMGGELSAGEIAINAYADSAKVKKARAEFRKYGICGSPSTVSATLIQSMQSPGGGSAFFLITELCPSPLVRGHQSLAYSVQVSRQGSPSGKYEFKASEPMLVELSDK